MFWAGSRKAESNWSDGWIFGLWRVRIHLLQLRRSFGSHQMKERLNSRICPKNLGGSKYVILKIAPEEKRVVELWEAAACWSGSHQLTQIWCFHLWAAADSQGREEGAIWHSSKLSCWPSAIKHLLHTPNCQLTFNPKKRLFPGASPPCQVDRSIVKQCSAICTFAHCIIYLWTCIM